MSAGVPELGMSGGLPSPTSSFCSSPYRSACRGWFRSPPHLDPWPAGSSPVFPEAHHPAPVGTHNPPGVVAFLFLPQLGMSAPVSVLAEPFFFPALRLIPRCSFSYLHLQLSMETQVPSSFPGQGPAASRTCTGSPPPAAPEACRNVGLLSLRSSTVMCTVPVVLRGGLPPSCTCTRSW